MIKYIKYIDRSPDSIQLSIQANSEDFRLETSP